MKKKYHRRTNNNKITLTIVAFLLLTIGIVSYWLLPGIVPTQTPLGIQLIPPDAILALTITTDPQQWRQLQQYQIPLIQKTLTQEIQNIEQQLLKNNGYSYERDIQPWIAKEMTIAYTGWKINIPNKNITLGQGMIMILPIDKPLQAKQILEQKISPTGIQFAQRNYQGITIRENQVSNPNNLGKSTISVSLIGTSIVITNHPKLMDQVIDTTQNQQSIASDPSYQQNIKQINHHNSLAQLYINVPALSEIAAQNSARKIDPAQVKQSQIIQAIAANINLQPNGLTLDGVYWLKPNTQIKTTSWDPVEKMANRLPANTLTMIAGGNLQQFWQSYQQGAATNPLAPINPSEFTAGVKSTTGLELETELLPWMAGEYSLSLIPVPPDTNSDLGAALVMMVESSDRLQAEQKLKELDKNMANRYQFQIVETNLNGQPVVTWVSQLGVPLVTRGWLDGNITFITLGAPVASTFVPQPQPRLAQDPLFIESLQNQTSSISKFYIDLDRTINSGNLVLPTEYKTQTNITQGIKSIGVTTNLINDKTTKFQASMILKKQ